VIVATLIYTLVLLKPTLYQSEEIKRTKLVGKLAIATATEH